MEHHIPDQPSFNQFYYSAVCHVCKCPADLKRCAKCKFFAYCSREHQKLHWPTHKHFCKTIETLLAVERRHHFFDIPNLKDLSFSEWMKVRSSTKMLWEDLLKRKLYSYEEEVWMFPRVCAVCRLADQNLLTDCVECLSSSYCANHENEHRKVHRRCCQDLKVCFEAAVYLFEKQSYPAFELKPTVELTDVGKFVDLFCDYDGEFISKVLISEVLSPGLTLLSALTYGTWAESLVIHVVGASVYENFMLWNVVSELVFHSLNVQKLNIVLIGPECDFKVENPDLCSDCECSSKSVDIVTHCEYYHSYVNEHHEKPDLVVSFNCGIHEYVGTGNDTWSQSLSKLISFSGIPVVITAYTEAEAVGDLGRLTSLPDGDSLEVLVECKKNQFGSLKPIRDWGTETEPVFYQNAYISIVRRVNV